MSLEIVEGFESSKIICEINTVSSFIKTNTDTIVVKMTEYLYRVLLMKVKNVFFYKGLTV